eukprot:13587124-Ditylum_brightwellii.AAC.1
MSRQSLESVKCKLKTVEKRLKQEQSNKRRMEERVHGHSKNYCPKDGIMDDQDQKHSPKKKM